MRRLMEFGTNSAEWRLCHEYRLLSAAGRPSAVSVVEAETRHDRIGLLRRHVARAYAERAGLSLELDEFALEAERFVRAGAAACRLHALAEGVPVRQAVTGEPIPDRWIGEALWWLDGYLTAHNTPTATGVPVETRAAAEQFLETAELDYGLRGLDGAARLVFAPGQRLALVQERESQPVTVRWQRLIYGYNAG